MSRWRWRRTATTIGLLAIAASACGGTSSPVPSVGGGGGAGLDLPRCEDVAEVEPPAEHVRDEPVYVANEQPIEELSAWASSKPGFEQLWIDRDHLGWVVLAFSEDAAERQDELTDAFPDAGAVVVEVEWTMRDLEDLQVGLMEDARARELGLASGISVTRGVVEIEVGSLTEQRLAAVADLVEAVGASPDQLCISGVDPATLPAEGPQQQAGDGWRLLADELVGEPYRTGIAADDEGYARLWDEVGLTADRPPVDLETEVVIWFGAVYGSSCPDLRLDDVVVDRDRALVYAEIVDVSGQVACTDDANPRAFVVAVERERLPAGAFAIQLRADDPPAGVPEERTLVDADLTQPGAGLPPSAVGPDPSLTEQGPTAVGPDDFIEPGYPAAYRFYLHCGPEWLGPLNDVLWRSEVTDTPAAWREMLDPSTEELVVEVLLETDPPVLTATANGHDVVYTPTTEDHPGCD
jgi:hypothetical protein